MDALDVKLESVFYEAAVTDLVELAEIGFALGTSRELLLVEITAMLLQSMSTAPQIASVAAMTVVLLAEQRSEK